MSGRAPTDDFLDRLAKQGPAQPPPRPSPPAAEFLASEAVQRYATSLDELASDERDRRLAVLAEFARSVDRTPDQMVAEIYNRETRKYRKRGFYSEKAIAFGAQADGPEHAQIARANVIRSFFIANGFRLPPQRPSWM